LSLLIFELTAGRDSSRLSYKETALETLLWTKAKDDFQSPHTKSLVKPLLNPALQHLFD
jgi:hypothetical protein